MAARMLPWLSLRLMVAEEVTSTSISFSSSERAAYFSASPSASLPSLRGRPLASEQYLSNHSWTSSTVMPMKSSWKASICSCQVPVPMT